MKRTIRVFSVILGVLAAGTFTAVADDDEKKEKKERKGERAERGERDGEGRRGRRGGPRQVPKEILEKYDKDKDGKLNEEERKAAMEARRAEFLKKFDKDGDGKLSDKEKEAARAEFQKRRGGGDRPRGERGGDRPPRGEGRPGGRRGGKKEGKKES